MPDPQVDRAKALARWLDLGLLDPLIGLILPGVGDVLTSVVGLYVVKVALARRLPPVVIARMLVNLGLVPLLGDVADVFHRANQKNVRLLEARLVGAPEGGHRSTPGDWLVVAGAVVLFLATLALPVVAAVLVLRALA